MMSPYPPAAIVNSFIAQNEVTHDSLTHLKIQKLLYFAQGWYMANYKCRLFDEAIEAWRHGPVVRSIYHALSGVGASEITSKLSGVYDGRYCIPEILTKDSQSINFLSLFWDQFHASHAYALTNATHLPGTPWRQVFDKCGGYLGYGEIIPDSLIENYFSAQLAAMQ